MPDDAQVEPDPLGSDVDLHETLYHYTDINGLAGMWEKGHIWATNSAYLNDTSEVRLGLFMARATLAERQVEILQQNNHQRAAFEPELTELNEISAAVAEIGDFSNSYIACLTEHGDQLSQWRGYAREGYCVGLDKKSLLESLADDRVMRRARYYDEATNDAYAARMIDIAKGFRNMIIGRTDKEDLRSYGIARAVMIEAAFMKDSSFREESEVRIVEISSTPNLFTPHRYGMVPRIFIPIPPGAIRSVRVAPSAHEELKQQSLVRYFLHIPFAGNPLPVDEGNRPRILRSSIPFRDW